MKDHCRVIEGIKRLESMIPSGFLDDNEWDFKKIWGQIKATQAAFNGSRFPTRKEHEEAWQNFQNLVNKVKEKEAEKRKQSAELRDKIVRMADRIPPGDDGWTEFLVAIATIGLSEVLKTILGVPDSRKQMLQDANKELKDLWELFTNSKNNPLMSKDRTTAYDTLKKAESRLQEAWDEWKKIQEQQSADLRDKIVAMAEYAAPPTWIEEFIGTIGAAVLTEGLSLVLEALLEPLADKEAELKWRNEEMKKAWEFFNSEKNNLLRQDREAARQALNEARARLDEAWGEYKRVRKKTMDEHYTAKREKHEAWRNRTEENLKNNEQRQEKLEKTLDRKRQNLENNQQRREKLEGTLNHKRQHLDKLYEKLDDARSNSYRERVKGWIDQEANAIQDIEGKLEEIDRWIEEDSDSIEDIEKNRERVNSWIEEDSRKLNS